jgi:hypothetical protein
MENHKGELNMSVIITSHAKKRIKKRLGIPKHIIQEISTDSYRYGIPHSQTTGSLNKYLTKLYMKYETSNNSRIYKEKVFIFNNNILITILDLPARFKKRLSRKSK